jgi:hypothetical protein
MYRSHHQAITPRRGPVQVTHLAAIGDAPPVAAAGLATGAVAAPGAVTGGARRWLRVEGLAALAAGIAIYLAQGGPLLWLVPLVLAVDISMVGYLRGPKAGAVVYNLAHNQAAGLLVLGIGFATGTVGVTLIGAILVAHVGMDRLAGYGLKYPTAFRDTHLGRIGR